MAEPREHHFNPEAATPALRRRLKASEPGRVAAALYRRRFFFRQVIRAPRKHRGPFSAAGSPPRRVRVVCWMPAGPGAFEGLVDTFASAVASSPGEVALLVTDDWSHDCDAAAIQALVPGAVVVRTRVPSGGPPRLWPVTALALQAALTNFDFDLFVKLDSDALVVGPGWAGAIASAIEAAEQESPGLPGVGIAGAFRERPDGKQELDEPYHRRVLADELPRDRSLAAWHDRALAAGWPNGSIVQGGCLVLTRGCCEAIAASGLFEYRPRLRTIVSEDLLLTLYAYALGYRAASLGGPSGPLAIANKHLPLPLAELLDPASQWRVTHSTKIGLSDEPEAVIRARAEAARRTW